MTFATLRALHAVIGTAIDEIERRYRHNSPQLDYPSLDEPCYPGAECTSDEELAKTLQADSRVAAASMMIVAACGQLSATVNKPWAGLMEDVKGGHLAACIRFLEAANIVEILREADPEGLGVNGILDAVLELRQKAQASQGDSPLTPSILSRILRLLATSHYLREVKPNVFTNNRRSSWLDSGKSLAQLRNPHLTQSAEIKYAGTSGFAAYVGLIADDTLKAITCLTDWALPDLTPITATYVNLSSASSVVNIPKALLKDEDNKELTRPVAPFNISFNTRLNLFQWLELPGNEERLTRFKYAMIGSRHSETKEGILRGFSWEGLPKGSVLVDIGGGIGATSILVAEAHPHLRVVVEDRAQVVSDAVSAWGTQYSHLFKSGRMTYRPRDFFQSWYPLSLPDHGFISDVPSVFLVRLILHDWPDNEARKILSQLRSAAGNQTKLVIGDMLLPYACAEDPHLANDSVSNEWTNSVFPFVPSDSPLLPNLGKANMYGYLTDIVMMGMFNGQERTVDEMKVLVLSAGWKITEIRRSTPGSVWAYTTAIPV